MADLTLNLKGDSSDLVKSIDQVSKAIGKLDDADSLREFAKSGVAAKAQLDQLTAAVNKLGDQATPELRKEVERLQQQFDKSFTGGKKRVGELHDAMGDVRDATRTLGSETFDLRDVFQAAFPKMAENVFTMVSAIGVAATALEGLGKAVDFVRKEMGPLVDAFSESFGLAGEKATALGAALHDITHPLDLIQGKSEAWNAALKKAREDWGFLIGQTEEAANAQQILTKFTEAHEKALAKAKEEQTKLNEELQKATLGFSFKEIQDGIAGVQDSFKLLASLGLGENGAFGKTLLDRVEKLDGFIKSLGEHAKDVLPPDTLKAFEALRDHLRETVGASEAAAKQQRELAKEVAGVVTALEKQSEAWKQTKQNITDLFAESTEGLDNLIVSFEDVGEAQEDNFESFEQGQRKQEEAQRKFGTLLNDYSQKVQKLPEEVRPALDALVKRFQFANENTHLTPGQIEAFKAQWQTLLDVAGNAADKIASGIKTKLGEAQTEFADLEQAARDSAIGAASGFESSLLPAIGKVNSALDGTLTRLSQIEQRAPGAAQAAADALAGGADFGNVQGSGSSTAPPFTGLN